MRRLIGLTIWLVWMTSFQRESWLPAVAAASEDGEITGLVVNGTDGRKPLADTDVVLRAGRNGKFSAIAQTTTDESGRFAFRGLAINGQEIYLPGANRHEVHFPGPRLRLNDQHPLAEIVLVAYDAVTSPSPLVVRRHDVAVRVETGIMEISEALTIDNPSRTAYVGESPDDRPPITLRLSLPPGFETVTFEQEFLGRTFLIHDNQLITDLPWPPGKREVKFVYRLPVEQHSFLLRRVLDLPTDEITLRVFGQNRQRIACDLPAIQAGRDGELAFAHRGMTLELGHTIELRMGDLPVRWERYAPWVAVGVLGLLLIGTVARNRWHRRSLISALRNPQTRGSDRRGRQSLPVGRSP